MNATHQPTPWELHNEGEKIEDADGEFVTRLSFSRYYDDREDPIAEANAAFIVTACNAHDDLVRALRYVLERINTPEMLEIRNDDAYILQSLWHIENQIRATLAKAGAA